VRSVRPRPAALPPLLPKERAGVRSVRPRPAAFPPLLSKERAGVRSVRPRPASPPLLSKERAGVRSGCLSLLAPLRSPLAGLPVPSDGREEHEHRTGLADRPDGTIEEDRVVVEDEAG
jgi:hypothetical protein